MKRYIYAYMQTTRKEEIMVRRINALIPDEMHRALRVKLAEDDANFSDWLRARIEEYVEKGGRKAKSPIVMPPVPRSELLPRFERRRKKREG
ncbi:MAG TPA: hypothetical protein VJ307_01740 [Candidatus Deferrimicrobiaceae bacterium]|jgi:hypothetical protein|nr:hypothetical protein [Candidatus Deferrimicrobiaceae bacterium]